MSQLPILFISALINHISLTTFQLYFAYLLSLKMAQSNDWYWFDIGENFKIEQKQL